MKSRGIEKGSIALGKRELHLMAVEILAKLRPAGCEVPGCVGLRVREIEGRSAFDRHIAMGDCALERQHGRQPVYMGRITFDDRGSLESEMIVPMGRLGSPARI